MTVGIPGAGIGGLFYLASALWMPVSEGWNLVRGKSTRARRLLVLRQVALTVGILAAMGGTAWGIEAGLQLLPELWLNGQTPHILTYSAFWIGVGTLTSVYLSMHAVRLAVGKNNARK